MIKLFLFFLFINIILIIISGCQVDVKVSPEEIKKQKIVFISDRDGNPEIYVMDEKGKNVIRITNNKSKDFSPGWSPDGRLIIFASERNGLMNEDIFTVEYTPKGGETNLKQITENKGTDKDPVYSPMGNKIAYISNQDSPKNEELFIMNPDGSSKIKLTTESTWNETLKVPWKTDKNEAKEYNISPWVYNSHPTWSPNGKRIAFESFGSDTTHKIYFINPDNPRSDSRAIKYLKLETTDKKGNPVGEQTWSTEPKGHWILGVTDENGTVLNPVDEKHPLPVKGRVKFELYGADTGWFKEDQSFKLTINYIDGTTNEIITTVNSKKTKEPDTSEITLVWKGLKEDIVGPGTQLEPDQNPDGHFSLKIEIGAVPMEYSPEGSSDMQPSWSPVGNKIAYVSDRDGNEEIYISNIDGSDSKRLTNNPAKDYSPSWSPDGTKIAFTSNREGMFNEEIYVINIDGTNLVNLTLNPYNDSFPVWSPLSGKN